MDGGTRRAAAAAVVASRTNRAAATSNLLRKEPARDRGESKLVCAKASWAASREEIAPRGAS